MKWNYYYSKFWTFEVWSFTIFRFWPWRSKFSCVKIPNMCDEVEFSWCQKFKFGLCVKSGKFGDVGNWIDENQVFGVLTCQEIKIRFNEIRNWKFQIFLSLNMVFIFYRRFRLFGNLKLFTLSQKSILVSHRSWWNFK